MLSSLILCNNSEPFLNRIVTCNKKWILYYNHQWLAQWLDQEAASKRWNFPKPNLYQKRSQPLFGLCPSDPLQPSWNPEIPLRLRSMLDNSKWDALKTAMPATISQQKRLNSLPQRSTAHCTTNTSKLNWSMKSCLIRHIHLTSHQLTSTSSSISTTLCRENAPTAGRQKVPSKSWSMDFFFILQE